MSLIAEPHQPVLLEEIVRLLEWGDASVVVGDFTTGAGGHLFHLLSSHPKPSAIYAVDQDQRALALAKARLESLGEIPIHWMHSNFADFAESTSIKFDRILVDLGVSSMQLDRAERGFSLKADGPLDMRMDQSKGITAAEWLKTSTFEEILAAMYLGEDRRAKWVAEKIIALRDQMPLATTGDLVKLLGFTFETRDRFGKHPLTRVFQGIRMTINREMEVLERLLNILPDRLNSGGRVAVITFHSGEDRVVKWGLRGRLKAINKKVIIASDAEMKANPRSRSAKLRVYEKE